MPKPPTFWRRAAYRLGRNLAALSGLIKQPAYAGGQSNRLTSDWTRRVMSADKELQASAEDLRSRSRDLARNDPYAAQFLRLVKDNVAGPHGVGLQVKLTNRQGRTVDEFNSAVEIAWRRWSRRETCTVAGRLSFVAVQRLVVEQLARDGEYLVRIHRAADNPFGFALQPLDVDLLATDLSRPRGRDGSNEIRMGVEVDEHEKPVAYHLYTRHPSDIQQPATMSRDVIPVPADDILHDFIAHRPGQSRGVPWMAPVMFRLRMLTGYEEAEVVAARAGAQKMGAITTDPESFHLDDQPPNDEARVIDAEAGDFFRLLPGEAVTMLDPQHPTTAYRDFVKGALRGIAAGLGASYAGLSADLEGTSYASGRTGLLQERDFWRGLQQWLCDSFCDRVFAAWLRYAIVSQQLKVDIGQMDRIRDAATWRPRGWAWVDPKNDIEARTLALKEGLTTRTRILGEEGYDLEETFAELKQEQAVAEEMGLELGEPVPEPAAPPPAQDDDEDDPGEDRTLTIVRSVAHEMRAMMPPPAPAHEPLVVPPANVTVTVDREPRKKRVRFLADPDGQFREAEVLYEEASA